MRRILVFVSLVVAAAQPPQPPSAGCVASLGQATSVACSTTSGTCSTSGTSASADWSGVSYSTATGKFTGSLVSNGCPHDARAFQQSAVAFPWLSTTTSIGVGTTAVCCSTTLPVTDYGSPPLVTPNEGTIGFAMYGEAIYNPLDNGFSSATKTLCTSSTPGGCPSMSDVGVCAEFAEATCGTAALKTSLLMSDCGGHASPWHYHDRLTCAVSSATSWRNLSVASGHSPLAGVMLDGRGLYGPFESASTAPSNLDACNGHVGPVPAFSATISGSPVSFAAASSVYHYHVSDAAPYTIGCFGPVESVAAAKALAGSSCAGTGGTCSAANALAGACASGQTWSACTSKGALTNYVLGCTIYQGWNSGLSVMETNPSQRAVATAACPACSGACSVGSAAAGGGGGSTSNSTDGGSSSSNALAIGLGVGLGVGVPLLTAAAFATWFYCARSAARPASVMSARAPKI